MEGKWQYVQISGKGLGLVHLVAPKVCWMIAPNMVDKAKAKFPVKDGKMPLVTLEKLAAEQVTIRPDVIEESLQLDEISAKDFRERDLPADQPICGPDSTDPTDPSKTTCLKSAHQHGSRIWIILLLAVLAGLALITTH